MYLLTNSPLQTERRGSLSETGSINISSLQDWRLMQIDRSMMRLAELKTDATERQSLVVRVSETPL